MVEVVDSVWQPLGLSVCLRMWTTYAYVELMILMMQVYRGHNQLDTCIIYEIGGGDVQAHLAHNWMILLTGLRYHIYLTERDDDDHGPVFPEGVIVSPARPGHVADPL